MLCCQKKTVEEERSLEIDKNITNWIKPYEQAISILLLGAGEAGKTTIIKQTKILHIKGFSESERKEKIIDILSNVHESIYDLVQNVPLLGLEFDNVENQKKVDIILKQGETNSDFSSEYFAIVHSLWNDGGVQDCYKRSNEFQLIDSAKYFLDKIHVLSQPNYIPTDQDILQCRKKTSGIQKIEFTIEAPKKFGGGTKNFWMFDVGGQRSERKKWIHVFEGITAILFLIASSDFDLTLREDKTFNRLRESINLFEDIWHSRFLANAGFIVFLNKQDTLEQKIRAGKSIIQYFPEYESFHATAQDGNQFDEYIRTRCFIRNKLINITREPVPGGGRWSAGSSKRECYYHFTIATNTENIMKVFSDVHKMILESVLNEFPL